MRKIIFLFFLSSLTFAQQTNSKVEFATEIGGLYNSDNRTPFWLTANKFGALPDSSKTGFLRTAFYSKIPDKNKFGVRVGAEVIGFLGTQEKIIVPELFLEAKLSFFRIHAGRKKQIHGIVDTTLSSGSFSWSGNALPIPEVQISIPEYLKFFNGIMGVKGHYSHGWFREQNWVRDSYLHQKSLYTFVGGGALKLHAGILHNVQWGGKPKYVIEEENFLYKNNRFARGLGVYRDIVLPFKNPPADTTIASSFDFENRYGNHLGQVDLAIELNLKNAKLLFYRNIPYETGQTFANFANIDDGLYGLSITNHRKPSITTNKSWLKKVVIEFLHTKNQGTYRPGLVKLLNIKGRQYDGNQNFYFSHAQYVDGWAYGDRTIGTPFLIPKFEAKEEYRGPARDDYSYNNRITALYLGILTEFGNVRMESKVSCSQNFGSDINVFNKVANQFSVAHKTSIPIGTLKNTLNVNLGLDRGDFLRDSMGALLSYKMVFN